MPLPKSDTYTTDYIYALPEGERAELIDGVLYDMAPPNTRHQILLSELNTAIANYIKKKHGFCRAIPAPFAVFLNRDNRNYVEPDISVICDRDKLSDRGCEGAPDWVIEIASPGTQKMDYGVKLFKYRTAGVREYWVVNPMTRTVMVHDFEKEEHTAQYSFDEEVPSCVFDGFSVRIAGLLQS